MIGLWVLLGVSGGAAFAWLSRQRPLAWWATGLVVAAVVYVAFALARGDLGHAVLEASGVALYGTVAWAGVRQRRAGLVAAAWALHPAWDLGVHLGLGLPAPAWYVWACLSFDVVVGLALVARTRAVPLS